MIVEVVGGAMERPEARVVDVDNLTALHLALGEVTDEEAAEVLERAGLGRFQDSDNAFLDAAALRAAAEPRATAPDWAAQWDAHGREGAQQGLVVRGRREPAGPRGERRRSLSGTGVHPLERRHSGWSPLFFCRCHCGDSTDRPVCRGAYDEPLRNPAMTGTPGRPLSAELSEQLVAVAVDILAEEGWGRLNSDRIAARARAGKAGIYRRWPTMAALARHAVGRFSLVSDARGRRLAAGGPRRARRPLDPAAGPRGARRGEHRRRGAPRGGPPGGPRRGARATARGRGRRDRRARRRAAGSRSSRAGWRCSVPCSRRSGGSATRRPATAR